MAGAYRHIEVEPQQSGFGARITGLDLARALPDVTLDEVKAAWARHSVVSFPDQPLDHDQLKRFTLQIGDFGVDPYLVPLAGHPHIVEVRREPDEVVTNFGAAWHSDWSFQEAPPAATILHAKVVPPVGGDTLFADTCRAYEDLSPTMREFLDGLHALHSAALPYATDGAYAQDMHQRSMKLIVSDDAKKTRLHPLVRIHPVTGRRALFVSPTYTCGIDGLLTVEANAILRMLYRHMASDKYVYRHSWAENTLIMWDNRTTLHSARGGYDGHLRLMHRTTVAGERPIAVSRSDALPAA